MSIAKLIKSIQQGVEETIGNASMATMMYTLSKCGASHCVYNDDNNCKDIDCCPGNGDAVCNIESDMSIIELLVMNVPISEERIHEELSDMCAQVNHDCDDYCPVFRIKGKNIDQCLSLGDTIHMTNVIKDQWKK